MFYRAVAVVVGGGGGGVAAAAPVVTAGLCIRSPSTGSSSAEGQTRIQKMGDLLISYQIQPRALQFCRLHSEPLHQAANQMRAPKSGS